MKTETQAALHMCDIEFTLPAFHENRNISCIANVDESHQASSNYNIIIGRDLMHALGINILFDTAEIAWDNAKDKCNRLSK